MKRPSSILLDLCGVIAFIAAAQVWTVPLWADFANAHWTLAWCNNDSSSLDWLMLGFWSLTGVIIVFSFLRFGRQAAYLWTLISYSLFWIFAANTNGSVAVADGEDSIFLIVFFLVMLWRYKSFTNDDTPKDPPVLFRRIVR